MLSARAQTATAHFAESRPVASEVIAVERAIAMCRATGAPTYIVHLSSAGALAAARAARAEGLPLFVETRPLYLYLTEERYRDPDGGIYVAQPPLRADIDREALWRGIADGTDRHARQRSRPLDPRAQARPQAGRRPPAPGRGRARHHVAALLHRGGRQGTDHAGAVRRAHRQQRRPPVRPLSAQGDNRGRLRRRSGDLGDARPANHPRRGSCSRAPATPSTPVARSRPGRRPPSAAARWCSKTAASSVAPAAASRSRAAKTPAAALSRRVVGQVARDLTSRHIGGPFDDRFGTLPHSPAEPLYMMAFSETAR